MVKKVQSGNILFIILIAVVLFASLSYAVTNSVRGGGQNSSSEISDIEEAKIADYVTLVQNTALRLQMIEGCSSVDYTPPESQPGSGDFSCYVFHPEGGAVPYENFSVDECELQGSGTSMTELAVGESCGNLIYAGMQGGSRLYAYRADFGPMVWSNPGTTLQASPASSDTDGMANTNIIVDLSTGDYSAAESCRALGPDWYLPADNELVFLVFNRENTGEFSGTYTNGAWYWSSTHALVYSPGQRAKVRRAGFNNTGTTDKNTSLLVRCVRRD